jgi:pyruvate carboxylase
VFFELNGQPRTVEVTDRSAAHSVKSHPKADAENSKHVAAPMPGRVVTISVERGQTVERGDPLLSIEAMKMETLLRAEHAGKIKSIPAAVGMTVAAHDLLIELE